MQEAIPVENESLRPRMRHVVLAHPVHKIPPDCMKRDSPSLFWEILMAWLIISKHYSSIQLRFNACKRRAIFIDACFGLALFIGAFSGAILAMNFPSGVDCRLVFDSGSSFD